MDETERLRLCIPLVIDWDRRERRPLPWRLSPTPYHVWISEIMLQQTRIEAVIGYYERFIAELPDVAALSAVDEDRLLKLWEGLGYYSRARNLKKAALLLTEKYGGRLPATAQELKKLPGIGDYTAGAIASMAFGEPESAVDGNVLRVLSRVLESGEDVMQPAVRKRMAGLLRKLYPRGEEAALLTEGLMELGETLCLPKGAPGCAVCPLRELCLASQHGTAERYPLRTPPRPRRIEERTVLLLHSGGRWAIRRRSDRGLLAGLWELPGLEGFRDRAAVLAWLESLGGTVTALEECGEAVHVFTHVEWHMRGFRAELDDPCGEFLWASPEEIMADYSIPTAFRAYYQIIRSKA